MSIHLNLGKYHVRWYSMITYYDYVYQWRHMSVIASPSPATRLFVQQPVHEWQQSKHQYSALLILRGWNPLLTGDSPNRAAELRKDFPCADVITPCLSPFDFHKNKKLLLCISDGWFVIANKPHVNTLRVIIISLDVYCWYCIISRRALLHST